MKLDPGEEKKLLNILYYIKKVEFPKMPAEHFFALNDALAWLYSEYKKATDKKEEKFE